MRIEHNGEETVVRFGEVDPEGFNYITFNRKKYRFRNAGSLYNPVFEFLPTAPSRWLFDTTETISIEIPEGAEVEYNSLLSVFLLFSHATSGTLSSISGLGKLSTITGD